MRINMVEDVKNRLGLDEEEVFMIEKRSSYKYRFKGDNLQWAHVDSVKNATWAIVNNNSTLGDIISGSVHVIKLPWEPKLGDTYYYFTSQGYIAQRLYRNNENDNVIKNNVGIFKTKQACFDDAIAKGKIIRV